MTALRKVTIALTSLLVFFTLAELAARAFGVTPHRVAAPMFSWAERGELYTMKPNGNWLMRGSRGLVRVNSLGLRGPEIPPKSGATRIVLLGDSVAFGYGVAEKRALPALLKRDLWAHGVPVDVIGAAVPGWCARQHRLFLEERGASLAPEVVLATVVLNDFVELQKGGAELHASVGAARTLNWLAERFALGSAARALLSSSENPFADAASVREIARAPGSPSARHAIDLEIAELRGVAAAARATGARFALVLIPFRFQIGARDADAPQRRIEEFARAEGIPALDLLPALRRYRPSEVFLDQVHLSELGNRVAAQTIAPWLLKWRLVGPRARP